ncbi:hypothetical protein KM176_09600 [Pseudooceanicola sp. CBS1P-1]|uniref:Uncharacterized protein n=1 Tax=Pseudooceanicola albus TaxID=2692189 RepID=A0A6L7G8D7_9RHOB|nr:MULTISPECIES: hypothetical protein [Pseudooceanicola]MBT9384112.1 hypothetical protein [Pseudooceanicola endophyticus]MXN19788.1 hypothetical protein [Pseudooceanicola albus]
MSAMTLTPLRLAEGRWHAQIEAPGTAPPALSVTWFDRPVAGIRLGPGPRPGLWDLVVPVPQEALCDGLQVFLVRGGDGTLLGQFCLLAGALPQDSLHAEVALLRAELDLLKRAFREQGRAAATAAGSVSQ